MFTVFMNREMTIGFKSLDNITILNTEHKTQCRGRVHRNNLMKRSDLQGKPLPKYVGRRSETLSGGLADQVIVVGNICSNRRYSKKMMLSVLRKLLLKGIG